MSSYFSSFAFLFPCIICAIYVWIMTKGLRWAIKANREAKKKANELSQFLKNNNSDVGEILLDMRTIAKTCFEMYEEYDYTKRNSHISIFKAFKIIFQKQMQKQDKLILEMNHKVKAEWNPRFNFLKENQNSFCKVQSLNNAFIECKEINKAMKKLTIGGINKINAKEDFIKNVKFALKATVWATIVIGGAVIAAQHMVNKAGKDIGRSYKSSTRYRDDDGNLFDEDGNRVPW